MKVLQQPLFCDLAAQMRKNGHGFIRNQDSKAKAQLLLPAFCGWVFYLLKSKLLGLQKGGFEDDFLSILPTAF